MAAEDDPDGLRVGPRNPAMSRPSWNPGRRHGTQPTRSPKHARVSASPSAAVANAIPESGCR